VGKKKKSGQLKGREANDIEKSQEGLLVQVEDFGQIKEKNALGLDIGEMGKACETN